MKQSHVRQNLAFLEQLAHMRYGNVRLGFLKAGGGVSQLLTIAGEEGVADIIFELSLITTLVQDLNLECKSTTRKEL